MPAEQAYFVRAGVQPDPCRDLDVELGAHGRGCGPWVAARKHYQLARHLHGTRAAWASPKWKHRVFLDPFCSWGRMQVHGETGTRDGGAVVAWRESLAGGFPFTRMLVGDLEGAKARACAARLQALGAPADAFEGPASETLPRMLAQVPRGPTLCMAYLDPFNLEHLSFDLFERLAQLRCDVLAHFSLMDLARNVDMELDPDRARFDAAAPGWRQQPWAATSAKASLIVPFFAYWQQQVQGLGFGVSRHHVLVPNAQGAALYRLVLFAKNSLPLRIWDDVARGPQGAFDFDVEP